MGRRLIIFILLLVFSWQISFASNEHKALSLMKNTAQDMQNYLKNNLKENSTQKQKKKIFEHIVLDIFLPNIAINKMVQDIVGPKYWGLATEQEKNSLVVNFREMIIKNYSTIVEHYKGHKVYFRKQKVNDKTMVAVKIRSLVVLPNGVRVRVNYYMQKFADKWKVVDFTLDGISFVTSYQVQFSPLLREQGVSGLLLRMRKVGGK